MTNEQRDRIARAGIRGLYVGFFGTMIFFAIIAALVVLDRNKQQPNADQLYGCTVQIQAPNGECT